jgi:integrase
LVKELTAAAIEKFRPGPERRRIRDALAKSLFLIIEPSGHKSFQMRFRRPDGKPAKLTLGPVDFSGEELATAPEIGQPLTLAAARLLAAKVHQDRARGLDPIGEHKARKHRRRVEIEQLEASTFAVAVRNYIKLHARPKTRNWRETARLLGLLYPIDGNSEPEQSRGGLAERWADRNVQSIDAHDIWSIVDEARSIGVPGMAVRNPNASEARARLAYVALSSLFTWLKRQRRVDANPCAGVPRPEPAKSRDRTLSNDEIKWFWRATDKIGGPFGTVFKVLLLTGARLDEVAGMTYAELNEDRSTWSLPSSRTKNKRAHVVPLPPMARDIIAGVEGNGAGSFVFTTNNTTPVSSWSWAKGRLDEAMLAAAREQRGPNVAVAEWRLHDLRRTAVTGLAELGVRPDVIELCVNHVSGHRGGIAGVYNRSQMLDERKAALKRWAAHVHGLVSGRSADVTPMQRARRGPAK